MQNPSFHVSLAWALGDVKQLIDDQLVSKLQVCMKISCVHVDVVKLTIVL